MICYRDMIFCSRDCGNSICIHNKKNIEDRPSEYAWMPVCFSNFSDCADYKKMIIKIGTDGSL